ncbi:MAG: amidohydrolase [Lachnospiraceae bacterium]|nr:amidohydrolase [Lachnospiraceae bacterium]
MGECCVGKEKYSYLAVIDEKAKMLDDCGDYLWENAETAFEEFKSAAYLIKVLREEGFEVQENLAGIPTAFSGRFGKGKPVIGILGEFDALSGLQQEAEVFEKKPIPGKTCGQGCGHNLYGEGALGAAIGVKNYLETSGAEGTVIFFGTPAEEGGSGKSFMARDGVFDELDAAVTWHPSAGTSVKTNLSLANYQIVYRFEGIPSHAGGKPEAGRSALDALELMNVGVQFLREHMTDHCRVHYAITDTGGYSPNVVQGHAEAIYLIRAPKNQEVKELYERVNKIAAGAALMTETTESHEFIKACSNSVINNVLCNVMQTCMDEIAPPVPDEEDLAFAKTMAETGLKGIAGVDPENPIHYEAVPLQPTQQQHGSTDVGDVSWVCPTVQINTATWAAGTPAHSWQAVSQGKRPWAHKMTRYAAKVMAATAVEIMRRPDVLEDAKKEHLENVGPDGYEAPIPKDVRPKAISKI